MNVQVGRWILAALVVALAVDPGLAQSAQKIGYVDSEYILRQLPRYQSVQEKLDQLEQQWRKELKKKQQEVERMESQFQARELLYTDEERKRKRQEIEAMKEQVRQFRKAHFGPEGQLYQRQKKLMQPLQERVLKAIETVARREGYDYVFDKSGDYLFLFAREDYDLSDQVLEELGVEPSGRRGRN